MYVTGCVAGGVGVRWRGEGPREVKSQGVVGK